ncbi:MAG: hydrogenase/urease maturation nickel metallochaperone HypA [Thermoplasmata archaeon]
MHEETLLRDLRRKVQEVARTEGGVPIRSVRIWVGALSHVTPDALRRRWPEVVDGTPAQGSRLEVDVSEDTSDPVAQGIRLVELTVEDDVVPSPAGRPGGGPSMKSETDYPAERGR